MIRLFYHHNYPKVWMLNMSEDTPKSFRQEGDVVILERDSTLIGYNLLNMPELHDGHHYLNDEKLKTANERLAEQGLTLLEPQVNQLYVGEIMSYENINEQAKLVEVDIGRETIQIVTTASNIVNGHKVVVALPGAVLYNGDIIRESKIYEHLSQGAFVSKSSLWGVNEDLGMNLVLSKETETGVLFEEPANKERQEC